MCRGKDCVNIREILYKCVFLKERFWQIRKIIFHIGAFTVRLVFIRHGDPDYSLDTLTEKGKREAELLAKRVAQWKNIDEIYVSPLGRAKATAAPSLALTGYNAVCLNWLREIEGTVTFPDSGRSHIPWDFAPGYWTKMPEMYHREDWTNSEIIKTGDTAHEWEYIKLSFDNFMRDHGYKHEGNMYTVEKHSDATVVLFCHMGVTLFLLGYMLNISPMLMMHGFEIPPTGITMISSEEVVPGQAYFRCYALGDTRHLYEGGEPVSQSGYFGSMFQEL